MACASVCAQSCLTLCDFMDCSPPGSSVHGISQARILEWVAIILGIFLTQGSNPHLLCLLHWQVGPLPLGPPAKPFMWPYMRSKPSQQPLLVTFSLYRLKMVSQHLTANSRRYWRTGEPGLLHSRESQRLRHDLVTEQQQNKSMSIFFLVTFMG